jgi:hypothetical protein
MGWRVKISSVDYIDIFQIKTPHESQTENAAPVAA